MASIHIKEIMKYLADKGAKDSQPLKSQAVGFFLQINFDDPERTPSSVIDEEFSHKIITVDSPYGLVTISFDHEGQLKSLEIS